jgi:hypothetical protein
MWLNVLLSEIQEHIRVLEGCFQAEQNALKEFLDKYYPPDIEASMPIFESILCHPLIISLGIT